MTPARIRHLEGGVVLLLAALIVVFATLRPVTIAASRFCIACGPHVMVDVLANSLLFVPMGAGLALIGARWRTALLVGAATTILVESLQLALPLGRTASISDIVANIAGTAVGFRLSLRRRAILYPRSRAALRFATVTCAAWLVVTLVTALAFQGTLPSSDYFGQWDPELGGFDRHGGEVVSVNVAGFAVPDGPAPDSDALRSAMTRTLRVDVEVIGGQARSRVAPIFRMADREEREILMLANRGHDLLFRVRMLATELRLVTPSVVLFDAMATSVDPLGREVVRLNAHHDPGSLRVAGWGRDALLELHSAAGWLLLVPTASRLQADPDLISAFWVGFPLFLAGYWTGRRARRVARRAGDVMRMTGAGGQIVRALPILLAVAAIGLSAISAMFGLSQPSWTVWTGALTGIVAGVGVGATTALAHDDRAHGAHRSESHTSEIPAVPA